MPIYHLVIAGVLQEKDLGNALKDTKGEVRGLFVAEAGRQNELVPDHIPQAIVEMQACVGRLKYALHIPLSISWAQPKWEISGHIHSTVADGKVWIFIFIKLNEASNAGRYWTSLGFNVDTSSADNGAKTVNERSVHKIVAILPDWVCNSSPWNPILRILLT